jgi:hypothetical protein
MNIVLLNWKDGENDPFSYINSELKLRFEDHGGIVDIVSTEGELAQNIFLLDYQKGIDAVIAHQGIVSNTRLASNGKLIWDELKISLICLHSDHPSQAPQNHLADSKYVFHTYCIEDFATYSNSTSDRINPAIFHPPPSFYKSRQKNNSQIGDYFVFPKNLDSIENTYLLWKKALPDIFYKTLRDASAAIIENYIKGDPINHNTVIRDSVSIRNIELIKNVSYNMNEAKIWHYIYQQTDKIYRNAASELVLMELADIPLHINGRGWERFMPNASKLHKFSTFNTASGGDYQFHSKYGIIDVVPHKDFLHDRTLRALAHRGGFLSNSGIFYSTVFKNLFFSGIKGNLRAKAESVISDPLMHFDQCQIFYKAIESSLPFDGFIDFIKTCSLKNV